MYTYQLVFGQKDTGCDPNRFRISISKRIPVAHTAILLLQGLELIHVFLNPRCVARIDIYSHITGAMQRQAAQKIERGIGHSEAYEPQKTLTDQLPAGDGKSPVSPPFAPYKGKVRKPGTGGIYELNDHLFEGRYSPTNAKGKREVHTVYAKTKEHSCNS